MLLLSEEVNMLFLIHVLGMVMRRGQKVALGSLPHMHLIHNVQKQRPEHGQQRLTLQIKSQSTTAGNFNLKVNLSVVDPCDMPNKFGFHFYAQKSFVVG